MVQDRRQVPSPINLFGGTSESVSLDLSLIDSNTGQVLRSQALRSTSTEFNESSVETVLISRLTDDIRGLLGLSGYTPYPVSGAKRDVVRPQNRTDLESDLTDAALLSADPLLNGTVTPTTLDYDAEPDVGPAIDISKPLLNATSAVEAPLPAETKVPPAMVKVPQSLEFPAREPDNATGSEEVGSPDEPCVITLDIDCSDPDSR